MPGVYHPLFQEAWDELEIEEDLLLNFNSLLDRKSNFFSLNEKDLEELVGVLDRSVAIRTERYYLTVARIIELVLHCAGNYANNGEFALMGDLLLNPRRVLIHIRGRHEPVVKNRHGLLTEQFRSMAQSASDLVRWFKKETIVQIKTKALLPDLMDRLENSGFEFEEYKETVHHRTRGLADLVGFLHAIQIRDSDSMFTWMKNASSSDQAMVQAKLFPFDLKPFFALGLQIRQKAHIRFPRSCPSAPRTPSPIRAELNQEAFFS